MATADPPPDQSSDELDGRPALTQNQSSRGNRLASDDPSAPGTRGRLSVRDPDSSWAGLMKRSPERRGKNSPNRHEIQCSSEFSPCFLSKKVPT